jgi:hypothetical protein
MCAFVRALASNKNLIDRYRDIEFGWLWPKLDYK